MKKMITGFISCMMIFSLFANDFVKANDDDNVCRIKIVSEETEGQVTPRAAVREVDVRKTLRFTYTGSGCPDGQVTFDITGMYKVDSNNVAYDWDLDVNLVDYNDEYYSFKVTSVSFQASGSRVKVLIRCQYKLTNSFCGTIGGAYVNDTLTVEV